MTPREERSSRASSKRRVGPRRSLFSSMVPTLADYQRLERLPTGPRSEVWLAKAPDGERVALKIVLPDVARRHGFETIFEKETSALLVMSHAHVLRARDRGGAGSNYFVAQEWGGSSLRALLRTG